MTGGIGELRAELANALHEDWCGCDSWDGVNCEDYHEREFPESAGAALAVVVPALERQAAEVARLTRERDEAQADRDAARRERDEMRQQRDMVKVEADMERLKTEGAQAAAERWHREASRPAIPADAVVLPDNWETRIRQALHARAYDISEAGPLPGTSSHDRDADRCADDIAGDVVVLINDWMSAPVSGSDTTEDGRQS